MIVCGSNVTLRLFFSFCYANKSCVCDNRRTKNEAGYHRVYARRLSRWQAQRTTTATIRNDLRHSLTQSDEERDLCGATPEQGRDTQHDDYHVIQCVYPTSERERVAQRVLCGLRAKRRLSENRHLYNLSQGLGASVRVDGIISRGQARMEEQLPRTLTVG